MRTPSPRKSTVLAVALLAPAVLLSACGGSSNGSSTTSATTSAGPKALAYTAKDALAGIALGGTTAKPTLTVAKPPFTTKTTTAQVVSEGTGAALTEADTIVANAMFVSAKTGKTLESTFASSTPQTIPVKSWIAGVAKSLVGKKAGTTMLVAIAPQDGPDKIAAGNPQAGIGAGETVLAYVDIKSIAPTPLKEVTGTPVAPKAGMPSVVAPTGKPATITVPKTAAPTTLQVQNLINGSGATVKAGDTISANYTGVVWSTGAMFDSNLSKGTAPASFQIGAGKVIPGWDKALVGKKVGDRVLVVVPPADGYGAQANGPIPANSTLVFVVDILSAFQAS